MLPAAHTKTSVESIVVYLDVDGSTAFYGPELSLEPLKEQDLGPTTLLVQGEGVYSITERTRAAVQSAYPGIPIVPLQAEYTSLDDNFQDLLRNHSYSLRVLPLVPFPRFIFSATLRKTEDDFRDVVSALTTRWSSRDLFMSALKIRFTVKKYSVIFRVSFNNLVIKQRREAEMDRHNLTRAQISKFIDNLITSSVIVIDSPIGEGLARQLAAAKAEAEIIGEHFSESITGVSMDDGSVIKLWDQVPVRQGNAEVAIKGYVSTEESTVLEL